MLFGAFMLVIGLVLSLTAPTFRYARERFTLLGFGTLYVVAGCIAIGGAIYR